MQSCVCWCVCQHQGSGRTCDRPSRSLNYGMKGWDDWISTGGEELLTLPLEWSLQGPHNYWECSPSAPCWWSEPPTSLPLYGPKQNTQPRVIILMSFTTNRTVSTVKMQGSKGIWSVWLKMSGSLQKEKIWAVSIYWMLSLASGSPDGPLWKYIKPDRFRPRQTWNTMMD